MSDVELVSEAYARVLQVAGEFRSTVSQIVRRLALLMAFAPALTSCAAPYVAGDTAAPTTIAVYVPPVGPHGRGSIMLIPYSPPIPPKHRKSKATPAKEASASDREERP